MVISLCSVSALSSTMLATGPTGLTIPRRRPTIRSTVCQHPRSGRQSGHLAGRTLMPREFHIRWRLDISFAPLSPQPLFQTIHVLLLAALTWRGDALRRVAHHDTAYCPTPTSQMSIFCGQSCNRADSQTPLATDPGTFHLI